MKSSPTNQQRILKFLIGLGYVFCTSEAYRLLKICIENEFGKRDKENCDELVGVPSYFCNVAFDRDGMPFFFQLVSFFVDFYILPKNVAFDMP